MLKGHTRKAQSLLAKVARFNCKPRLSAELVLESAINREDKQQLQHFTVSDGEQEDTEDQIGETDEEASVSFSPVVVPRHQEKKVKKNYVYLCAIVREEREKEAQRRHEALPQQM